MISPIGSKRLLLLKFFNYIEHSIGPLKDCIFFWSLYIIRWPIVNPTSNIFSVRTTFRNNFQFIFFIWFPRTFGTTVTFPTDSKNFDVFDLEKWRLNARMKLNFWKVIKHKKVFVSFWSFDSIARKLNEDFWVVIVYI